MYRIFIYIWDNYGVNVAKYSIHGAYGSGNLTLAIETIDQLQIRYLFKQFMFHSYVEFSKGTFRSSNVAIGNPW